MASLSYNEVYSSLFPKIEVYDFIDLSEETLNEFLCNWLHSAVTNPCVRKLFKTVVFIQPSSFILLHFLSFITSYKTVSP